MHMFTFGGLSLSSADYMKVGRFCSSRRGGEGLVHEVRRGIRMPRWLGPPCKVKSNRFSDMSTLVTASQHSVVKEKWLYHVDEHMNCYLLFHYVCSRFGYANIRIG